MNAEHLTPSRSVRTLPNLDALDPLVAAIVQARQEQKMSLSTLSDLAGINRRSLYLIERGGDCTLSTLRRLATALNLEFGLKPSAAPTLEDAQRENERAFRQDGSARLSFSRPGRRME